MANYTLVWPNTVDPQLRALADQLAGAQDRDPNRVWQFMFSLYISFILCLCNHLQIVHTIMHALFTISISPECKDVTVYCFTLYLLYIVL